MQEAIVRGLSHLNSFTPGTSLQAWLFTILRNQFHTSFRRRKREVEDPDGTLAGMLSTPPEQHGRLDYEDFRTALAKLPLEHREVFLLIGAEGLSYEEAAQICGAKVGTIKSRMNRARARLAELLHIEDDEDLRGGRVLRAALSSASGAERASPALQRLF